MSQSPFLPDASSSYSVANPNPDGFTYDSADLLQRIGDNMEVRRASTEGRIPSPVSRAYMFYANLFQHSLAESDNGTSDDDTAMAASDGRKALQQEARRTLRGLLAAFALRNVLGIDIRSKEVELREDDPSDVGSVLVPTLAATPGGKDLWNPVQFYTVVSEQGGEEVLAGRSPLTGIYPSATAPQSINGLYWYDSGSGTWYDPTSRTLDEKNQMRVSDRTRTKVQGLIKMWVDHVLRNISTKDLQQQGLEMEDRDASDFINELEQWRADLSRVEAPSGVDVVSDKLTEQVGRMSLPFLSFVVEADPDHIWGDLPLHEGRLVVTEEQLLSNNTRLYGRAFGSTDFADAVQHLDREGDNLGQALGLGEEAIPMPYLFVDRLFMPYLTLVTSYDTRNEDHGGFSSEWSGLEVNFEGTTEYYFIPMDPDILEIMEADALRRSLSAHLSSDGQNYVVTLNFGEVQITKLYSTVGKGPHRLDEQVGRDEFDLRLFPNYDLDAVRHLIADGEDGASHTDDTYHARVRLSPTWDFDRVDPFAVQGRRVAKSIQDDVVVMGDETSRSGSVPSPGKAAFYTISDKPDGFFVPERGFCLLALEDPRGAGQNPSEWSVSIDFGTSNTCIAHKEATDAPPEPLSLPVLTTTLLEKPNYNATFGNICEGGSAALDFPYKFGVRDDALMSQLYFPTQLLTQQQKVEEDDNFAIENGLIYFDNVGLADPTLLSLIKGFPQIQNVAQRFSLKQDIKWTRTDWLRVFMHHLRKQIVLTAAAANASITALYFSYPKSFNYDRRQRFKADMDMVWGDTVTSNIHLASESEAARDDVVDDHNQHVIFDVGGGTTDIIAFDRQEPVFQTSFKLAAGQINDFIQEAPTFRAQFVEAIEQRAKRKVLGMSSGGQSDYANIDPSLVDGFKSPSSNPRDGDMTLQMWLGLLQQITDVDSSNDAQLLVRILNYLRTEASEGDAIQGFFLSNLLLMGGLAYFAGQLMKMASEGKLEGGPFPLSKVTITLTGNGSRLYNMLTDTKYEFSSIMEKLFRVGATVEDNDLPIKFDGLHRYNDVIAPKVSVALGLLKSTDKGELRDVPVANITGEEGYPSVRDTQTEFSSSLVEYYQAIHKNEVRMDPPVEVPQNLERFLDALEEALPYGMHREFKVIPAAHKEWADKLKSSVYRQAVPSIKDRGYENAKLADGIESISKKDRPALEPLFVAQIAGLIDAVREQYAQ